MPRRLGTPGRSRQRRRARSRTPCFCTPVPVRPARASRPERAIDMFRTCPHLGFSSGRLLTRRVGGTAAPCSNGHPVHRGTGSLCTGSQSEGPEPYAPLGAVPPVGSTPRARADAGHRCTVDVPRLRIPLDQLVDRQVRGGEPPFGETAYATFTAVAATLSPQATEGHRRPRRHRGAPVPRLRLRRPGERLPAVRASGRAPSGSHSTGLPGRRCRQWCPSGRCPLVSRSCSTSRAREPALVPVPPARLMRARGVFPGAGGSCRAAPRRPAVPPEAGGVPRDARHTTPFGIVRSAHKRRDSYLTQHHGGRRTWASSLGSSSACWQDSWPRH